MSTCDRSLRPTISRGTARRLPAPPTYALPTTSSMRGHWTSAKRTNCHGSCPESGQWGDGLAGALAQPALLRAAWNRKQDEVKEYWTKIEENSPHRMVDAYSPALEGASDDLHHTALVSLLLGDQGHLEEAFAIGQSLIERYERAGDRSGLAIALGNQSVILNSRGRLDEALMCSPGRKLFVWNWATRTDCSAATETRPSFCAEPGPSGRGHEAMPIQKEEAICLELGDRHGLSPCYGNQALLLRGWGRLQEALEMHKKEEQICREFGDKNGLQRSYGNQAVILRTWGRLEDAMVLHRREEALCRELGDKRGLEACYGNQAGILQDWGRLEEAMALHKKKEAICLELGYKASLAVRRYGNQGPHPERLGARRRSRWNCTRGKRVHLPRTGRPRWTTSLLRKSGRPFGGTGTDSKKPWSCCTRRNGSASELGNKEGLATSYGSQGVILDDWDRLEEAMALHQKEQAIYLELNDRSGLMIFGYGTQAVILIKWRRFR